MSVADGERVDAGFRLVYAGQTWRHFVEAGELGRTLVHLCLLAEPMFPLSFVVESIFPEETRVRLVLNGDTEVVRVPVALANEPALDGLEIVILALAELLGRRGIAERFEIVYGGGPGPRGLDRRIVLAAPGDAGDAPPPALRPPEEVVSADRRLDVDPSYPELLAMYVERLAMLAGIRSLTCTPTPSRDPKFVGDDFFSLRVVVRHESGGALEDTVRITSLPRPDLQPIFDCLNDLLPGGQRLYRFARAAWGEGAVLADDAEAARLRRAAYLVEPHEDRELLRRLGEAGFELPFMYGDSVSFVRGETAAETNLHRTLTWLCLLARPLFPASFEIHGAPLGQAATGPVEIALEVAGRAARVTWPPRGADPKDVLDAAVHLLRAVNAQLAATGTSARFLIVTGEPLFRGHRIVLLDGEWVGQVAALKETVRGCLEPGREAVAPLPHPRRYPPMAIEADFPHLRRVDELVPAARILDSDFKSSARPSDYLAVFEEIAEFAGLAVSVGPARATDERDHHFDIAVRAGGAAPATVRMANKKYPDVRPMVRFLNDLLAAREDTRRLHRFRAGGFSTGVALVDDVEAASLRQAAYLLADRGSDL